MFKGFRSVYRLYILSNYVALLVILGFRVQAGRGFGSRIAGLVSCWYLLNFGLPFMPKG